MNSQAQFSKNSTQAVAACERYEQIAGKPRGYKRINLLMDLKAADGVNGNPAIDWQKLMAFDDFNFLHDLGGISRHMDRQTGKIGGCFLIRSAKHEAVAA